MRKAEIDKNLISKIISYFSSRPVLKVWLFGSYSRGEETPESDVDILVQFDPSAMIDLFDHVEMKLDLEEILKVNVDLVTDGTLMPWALESVDNDKILIYERKTARPGSIRTHLTGHKQYTTIY